MRVAAWMFDVCKGDVGANREAALRGLEAAGKAGAELVLLPEMWPTSFLASLGDADPAATLAPHVAASLEVVEEIGARAGELGLAVAGSAYAPAGDGRLPFNRFGLWSEGRELLGYDKVHLFTLTAEHLAFTAGDRPPGAVELIGHSGASIRVAGLVCYDLRFAPVIEAARAAGAELLLVPAQWPTSRSAHFESLLAGRATESQAFVLGGNRVGEESLGRRRTPLRFEGNARLVGPDGNVRAAGDGRGEALVVGEVDPDEVREVRRQVRVVDDRREALYADWPRPGTP